MPNIDPSTLYAPLLWSCVGSGFLIYGKKQSRAPAIIAGLALIAMTFFVTAPLAVNALGLVLAAGCWYALRLGY